MRTRLLPRYGVAPFFPRLPLTPHAFDPCFHPPVRLKNHLSADLFKAHGLFHDVEELGQLPTGTLDTAGRERRCSGN